MKIYVQFWAITLSEIHKVTLGVHRYEKCDLIGDDMGDKYQCNGYNKTQVSAIGGRKSSHIILLLEDGDRRVVHPPKVWADQDGLGPRNHPTTGVFFLQKGSIQMNEYCRPADLWRPNIVVACLPQLDSDAWKDWTRKDMLVQVKTVKSIWMNYLSFPDSHIFVFFLQRVWGWKNTRYGQMEVKIKSTPTMWWNWLWRWTLLAFFLNHLDVRCGRRKGAGINEREFWTATAQNMSLERKFSVPAHKKVQGIEFFSSDSLIFCFFTFTFFIRSDQACCVARVAYFFLSSCTWWRYVVFYKNSGQWYICNTLSCVQHLHWWLRWSNVRPAKQQTLGIGKL